MAAPDPKTSRRLFRTGLIGLLVAIVGLARASDASELTVLVAGAVILALGAYPALYWAHKSQAYFPVFEMFMLTTIPFYAVPLMLGHREVMEFSAAATTQAAVATILFQISAIAVFLKTRPPRVRSAALKVSLLPSAAYRYGQAGVWLNNLYLYVSSFTDVIPRDLAIVAKAMFFGIGTVALFIEMRRWGAGVLQSWEKFVLTIGVTIQLIFLFRDLYLIVGISVLLLALIGYVSTSRQIPLVLVGAVFALVAVLHNGKSAMRDRYWTAGHPLPSLGEIPGFFQDWIENGLTPQKGESEAGTTVLAERLFERASLFQMLCLVTERTPALDPFLAGDSYRDIHAQLVPRFLWPDKPSSLDSNTLLAVHYHLVSRENPTSVSIAFGMIAEAYANFGLLGCVLLGAVMGFAYKRISLAALGQPQFSALGLTTILLAAWSFQVEQILASWLVSLVQAAVVVVGGPMVFRTLFRQD